MGTVTKKVAADERRQRARAIKLFKATSQEFINKVNEGTLQVPTFTRRVWVYVPMFPPIPIFYRNRAIFNISLMNRWRTNLAINGKMVSGPSFLQGTWAVHGLDRYSSNDLYEATQALRAIMHNRRYLQPSA